MDWIRIMLLNLFVNDWLLKIRYGRVFKCKKY